MNHPATDTAELADARTYLDALKKSFTTTWQGTEHTVLFLMQTLQRQSQQIQNLEGNTNLLEKQNQEKSDMINVLEARIAELESHANARDKEMVEVRRENDKLKAAFSHALSRCREFQSKMLASQADHQSASAEVASLRAKLVEAEERAVAGAATAERNERNGVSSVFSEEQLKKMETALKKELETRSDVVRKATREAIAPLRNAYVASLARVKELEEQLQKHQTSESAVPHTVGANSSANDESPSSSTFSHIVSGKYRPKPSPSPLGQNGSVTTGSNPASLVTPSQLSHSAQINPLPSSTIAAQEVIDLTDDHFPEATWDGHSIVEGAAHRLKRKRADSDNATLPPSETYTTQSTAHRPTQGETDSSQPQDMHR